jgi:hypothetical protein
MMGNVGRREFVQGVGLVVGALAATADYPPALSQLTTNVGSKPMTMRSSLSPLTRRTSKVSQYSLLLAVAALVVLVASADPLWGQQTSVNPSASASEKPFLVEWVYKVKWGHADEFWQVFKKYQIPVLNRQKELGYVISYTVYRPGYHTGEDTRWEYRIVVAYKNLASSRYGREVTKQLFPDQATLNREENRRWELTEAHYDLPIRIIDPNGDGEE